MYTQYIETCNRNPLHYDFKYSNTALASTQVEVSIPSLCQKFGIGTYRPVTAKVKAVNLVTNIILP